MEGLELRKCLRYDGIFIVVLIVRSGEDSDEPSAHDRMVKRMVYR